MSSLLRRDHRPRTPGTDPSADLHFDAPTYLLVSNPASTALFTFLAIFLLGLTTGCVVPRLAEWYRGESEIGTGFWVCSAISLLVNGWTCARLKGMFVHEITAPGGERTPAGTPTRRFVECDFSWIRFFVNVARKLGEWLSTPR